jgi:GNAT superfamily N-acetyltransferase
VIVRAEPRDAEVLARVVYNAFQNIAPCVWLFPNDEDRQKYLPALLRMDVEEALEGGLVYTIEDRSAAALWYVHHGGPFKADPGHDARVVEAVGPEHAARIRAFGACTGAVRPAEPHDYLFIAAVDPAKQRQGIGSRLLAACHRELAQAGRPAYLEASDEGTRSVYLGLGYADTEGPGIVLPGPEKTRLYPMLRPSAPAVSQ